MPQITVYIPKAMDAAWRAAPEDKRAAITAAIRKMVARRLAAK